MDLGNKLHRRKKEFYLKVSGENIGGIVISCQVSPFMVMVFTDGSVSGVICPLKQVLISAMTSPCLPGLAACLGLELKHS